MRHPLELPIVKAVAKQYMLMIKLYVKPDGGILVTMGNQTFELTGDEVHALLCGMLDMAKVFASMHASIDVSTYAILSAHNGQIPQESTRVLERP